MNSIDPMIIKEVTINSSLYVLRVKYPNNYSYNMDIEAFRCDGETVWEKGITYDPPKNNFPRKGATSSEDSTYDLDDAQRVFEGSIKWDGCSDLEFYPDSDNYEHFCSKQSAVNLGLLLGEAYELVRELLGDKVDQKCFDT